MAKQRIDNVKGVFKFVKLLPLLEEYTDINPKGGIYHRINGKSTSKTSTRTSINKDEERKLKSALLLFSEDVRNFAETLDAEGDEVQ